MSAVFEIPGTFASDFVGGFLETDVAPTGGDDYFEETSLTENGAMTDPEFLVKFKCVKLVDNGLC